MRVRLMVATVAVAVSVRVPPSSPATAGACQPGHSQATTALPEAPAAAVPLVTQETRIHWTRVTTRLTYRDAASLEGQVVTDDGAVTDAVVDLDARPAGSDEWRRVASTTSDHDTGVFAFGCLLPPHSTDYRVSYAGTALHGASQGRHRVEVARRVPDTMRKVAPARFVYSGSVAPRYAGPVRVQRRDCARCAWRSVATTSTGPDSDWRFGIDVSRLHGEHAFRALVPADERFARSVSERFWRITVR